MYTLTKLHHYPFLRRFMILILPVFALLSPAQAAEPDTDHAVMNPVIVSVTRTETSVEKVGGNAVTVIGKQAIEASKATTVKEIIDTVPGITSTANGGIGTTTSVSIRGADAKNTLIMIDGIMLNDPSNANRTANLSDINVDNIERIEIIRGAMSVMYGSNATAGIINIITQKGNGKPSFTVKAETGSYKTNKASIGASGAINRVAYSLSASRTKIKGYSIADDDNNDIPHNGNTNEKDGHKNTTLSANTTATISDNFKISTNIRYIDSETELDDYSGGFVLDNATDPLGPTDKRVEAKRFLGKIAAENVFASGFLNSKLVYSHVNNDRQSYNNDGSQWYDYDGTTDTYSWYGDFNFDTHTLTVGADYMKEFMESDSSHIGKTDVYTQSAWIQDQLFMGDSAVIIAGTRYDDHEKFGDKTTYRLAPSYTVERWDTTLKASIGTGFRSPSLYELYSDYGNTNLDPEESLGWDAGIEQGFNNHKVIVGITYFETDYDNKIEWTMTDPVTFNGEYQNVSGKTETCGLESFIDWKPLKAMSLQLNYTYTDTKDPDGKRLERRPYHKVNLNTRYRFLEKGMLSINTLWSGDRKASRYAKDKNGIAVKTLDDYFLVNLSTTWEVNTYIQVSAKVENLLDEYYEEAFSYATPGLSGYVGIKLTY